MTDRRTVLVVEDSPTQALHLQTMLEQEGLRVIVAEDGRRGLEKAQEIQPDLVVLDVQMPEMNGMQVCQELNEHPETADIPVVLFTAHDEQESVILGLQLGAVDFIPKDVFADVVLMETIRQMGLIPEAEPATA
ncbi:MAG: response regulator [Chloroflexi bacterium]|jgi:CheY-like chemotaxis protein|nr:response regulator [Chloroflexota bacterium]